MNVELLSLLLLKSSKRILVFRIYCNKMAETDTNTTEMIEVGHCIDALRSQFTVSFQRNNNTESF